jgi:PKD repeat protein
VTDTVLGAGVRILNASFVPTDSTNYSSSTNSVTLTVNKATPTITWNNPADITNGTALSGIQLNAIGSVLGSFVYNPISGTILAIGTHTLDTTFTPTDSANYTTATDSVQINVISKSVPTITWVNPSPIIYGTALSGTQLNAESSVPGSLTYNPASGVILGAGTRTLNVSFIPTDTTNYSNVTTSVSLTVNKATTSITWSNPSNITYGTAISSTQLNAVGSVPGSMSYNPAAETILGAGTKTLNATFTPTDSANYSTSTDSVQINITKVTPAITWNNPSNITYGTALSGTQLNAVSATQGTFTYNPVSGTVLGAGARTLNTTLTPVDSTNYTTATASVSINVTKVTPTITWANPENITNGTALSATQLNAIGSVPGSFVYNPVSGTVLAAGIHTLNTTFTPTDGTNYTTATASVAINVTEKITPTITWTNPGAITYGTALSGTQLNANSGGIAGFFVYSPASGTVLPAGSHTLNVTFNPTNTATYNSATASVTLNVNKASTSITWSNPTAITYGTALSGTQLNAVGSRPGTLVYDPVSGSVLGAGTKTLNVTFTPTDSTNYSSATGNVTLIVNKATPTITWNNPANITGGTALSGTQLNATSATAGTFTYNPASGTVLAVGTHTLQATLTPTDGTNYTSVSRSVTINVTQLPPIANFTGTPTSGNTPIVVQFTDSSTNTPTSWSWNFGDGDTSTTQNPSHTYTGEGLFTVTLTVTNAGGSNTTSRIDYISTTDASIHTPAARFESNVTNGTIPLTVQFNDTSLRNPTSWEWNFGDGSENSTDQNPVHTYEEIGRYNVTLRATNNFGYNVLTRTNYITVRTLIPIAAFTVTTITPTTIQFNDMSDGAPTSWLWDFGDNTTSTEQHPMHVYNTTGVYNVSLRVINAHGSDNISRDINADITSADLVISSEDQRLVVSTTSNAVQIAQSSDLVDAVVSSVSSGIGVGTILILVIGGVIVLRAFEWL